MVALSTQPYYGIDKWYTLGILGSRDSGMGNIARFMDGPAETSVLRRGNWLLLMDIMELTCESLSFVEKKCLASQFDLHDRLNEERQ